MKPIRPTIGWRDQPLHRRSFLSVVALGMLSLATAGRASAQAVRLLRMGPEHRVLISEDGGRTWDLALALSPGLQVDHLYVRNQSYFLEVQGAAAGFTLRSVDGRHWYHRE